VAASFQALACCQVSDSPPNMLCRSDGMLPGDSLPPACARLIAEGTAYQWVRALSATYRTGRNRSLRLGTTRVAPADQTAKRSNTDGSKVRSKNCEHRD